MEEILSALVGAVNQVLWDYLLIYALLGIGLFFTLYLGAPQITKFGEGLKSVFGGLFSKKDKDDKSLSQFQALAVAVSAQIGTGNVAGVAVAITVGGPGATLWIILAGFLGMSIKAAEATLGATYRRINDDGTVSGGPMYYLQHGLAERGMRPLGVFLAGFYAFAMMIGALGAGNIFQANQVAVQLTNLTGGEESILAGRGWMIGLALAVLAAVVIFGGIRSIARWTSRLTPIMAILYVLCVLVILGANVGSLPSAVGAIFDGAFTGEGVQGGVVGVAIIGVQRALFSNAAGVGSAASAAASWWLSCVSLSPWWATASVANEPTSWAGCAWLVRSKVISFGNGESLCNARASALTRCE